MAWMRGEPLVAKMAWLAKYAVVPGAMIAALIYSPPDYASSKNDDHKSNKQLHRDFASRSLTPSLTFSPIQGFAFFFFKSLCFPFEHLIYSIPIGLICNCFWKFLQGFLSFQSIFWKIKCFYRTQHKRLSVVQLFGLVCSGWSCRVELCTSSMLFDQWVAMIYTF